jgi:hypothetical protein
LLRLSDPAKAVSFLFTGFYQVFQLGCQITSGDCNEHAAAAERQRMAFYSADKSRQKLKIAVYHHQLGIPK